MAPRFSIVWYEMQRRASISRSPVKAPVGHATRQRRQRPQWSPWLASSAGEVGGREYDREEQVGRLRGNEHAAVLAEETETGLARPRPLEDRTGVDTGVEPLAGERELERAAELAQPLPNRGVVVAAPRVARDLAGESAGVRRARPRVVDREDDSARRTGEE
jgi:hypothetical protein